MVRGIGIDIVENVRFKGKEEAFLRRIFTDSELSGAPSLSKEEYFSSRFASKEAFVKALGTGFSGITARDVEIAEDDAADEAFVNAKQMVTEMIRTGDSNAQEAPDLLMIAKYLERMGDHAASLARWVLNALDVTGDWINNPVKVD